MTHPETALVPYLRGELSDDERERVEHHLQRCEHCRVCAESSAAVLRQLANQLEQLPEPDWTVYRAELRRKLAAREDAPPRRWQPQFAWASIATASAAIATLLIVFGLHRPGVSTPPVEQLALEDALSGADVGLLRNYPVVEHLDMLEDYDVIEHLDEVTPPVRPNNEFKS